MSPESPSATDTPASADAGHDSGWADSAWYRSLRPRLAGGHEVRLLDSGAQYFPALIEAIDGAAKEVFIETYIFADDRSGRRVARALARAAERGVQVTCVIDGFGTPRLLGDVARFLSTPGIRVETFRPERRRFALDRQRLRRLHRKMVVIDGRIAFIGGINMLDDWFDPNHGELSAPRYDFAVQVRGPLVGIAHLATSRLWWELDLVNRSLGRPRIRGLAASAREPFTWPGAVSSRVDRVGAMRAMLMLRDNVRYRRTIEGWYLRAIGRAKRDVLIANAYFLPGVRFRRALARAAARGVRVRLLLQGRVEYKMQHYATQALYERLLRHGIEIYEYRHSFLHAKVAVIDDQATIGSSNIDPFSLLLAREANVVVDDSRFAGDLRENLELAIAERSERQALETHRRRPLPIRAMNWVAFVLLRFAVSISGVGDRY
ncbi:MAG: cardiolipin synthase ClsB [Burkholderiaceae bacterium]